MGNGPPFLVDFFGPFVLLGFIVIILAGMAGAKPDTLLKPFFAMLGMVLKGVFDLLGTALKIAAKSASSAPPPPPALKKSSQGQPDGESKPGGKKPKIKIVVDEDED